MAERGMVRTAAWEGAVDDDVGDVLVRYRLDADAYERMHESGIIPEDARVELIDGEIVEMAPIGDDHAGVVNTMNRMLVIGCGERAIVSPQNPVKLDQRNWPQPDFVLFRPRADFYRRSGRAGPADVLLAIEVADSSLRFDRSVKLKMYARTGIPEVWIVNLKDLAVETHRRPGPDGYAEGTTHRAGETIAAVLLPEARLEIGAIFY